MEIYPELGGVFPLAQKARIYRLFWGNLRPFQSASNAGKIALLEFRPLVRSLMSWRNAVSFRSPVLECPNMT